MKSLILIMAALTLNLPAHAEKDRGGGDLCENRIKLIAADISSWINHGGATSLVLSNGVSLKTYSADMLYYISQTKVRCVAPGDKGYPVQINGTAKTCRFDKKDSDSRITCDLSKFQALSESDQYVLIHHEYAGLSDIETPRSDDSDYKVSNQITDYLVPQTVLKLAVKNPTTSPGTGEENNDPRFTFAAASAEFAKSPSPEANFLSGSWQDIAAACDPRGTSFCDGWYSTNSMNDFGNLVRVDFSSMVDSLGNELFHAKTTLLNPKQNKTLVSKLLPVEIDGMSAKFSQTHPETSGACKSEFKCKVTKGGLLLCLRTISGENNSYICGNSGGRFELKQRVK